MPRAKDIRNLVFVWAIAVVALLAGMAQLAGGGMGEGYQPLVRADSSPFAVVRDEAPVGDEVLAATSTTRPAREPRRVAGQRSARGVVAGAGANTRPRGQAAAVDARSATARAREQSPPRTAAPYPRSFLTATIPTDTPVTEYPGRGRILGTMTATSRYLGAPTKAWILERTEDGRFGKVHVPWEQGRRTGWIPLKGASLDSTKVHVRVSISRHELSLVRDGKVRWTAPVATGANVSPTPHGRYWVTDLVPIPGGGPFGHFAFGISGLQNNLPPGWSGGDQMAIHGTNDPGSIGTNASAGCVRASAEVLERLRTDVRVGTPVILER